MLQRDLGGQRDRAGGRENPAAPNCVRTDVHEFSGDWARSGLGRARRPRHRGDQPAPIFPGHFTASRPTTAMIGAITTAEFQIPVIKKTETLTAKRLLTEYIGAGVSAKRELAETEHR